MSPSKKKNKPNQTNKKKNKPGVVAQACNPSYWGRRVEG
jgi:hypothetical protein